MKMKFIKELFIKVIIIYFFLSLIFFIYSYCKYDNILDEYQITETTEFHEEKITIPNGQSLNTLIESRHYLGALSIIRNLKNIFLLSIFIAVLLNSIKYSKEYSILRYFLVFILGNFILNVTITSIRYIFMIVNEQATFLDACIESFYYSIIPYIFIFCIVLGIKKMIDKAKIKELNDMLKSKKKN